VQQNHAAITPAPSTVEIELSLPVVIGETVAIAAITIAKGLEERGNGGLTVRTKEYAGDLVAALFNLHQKCAGDFDFDSVAREYGKLALRARYTQLKRKLNGSCPELADEALDEMVNWPLDTLYKVIDAELH
jgi:hypothetical protein